jgi:hypothetical protein
MRVNRSEIRAVQARFDTHQPDPLEIRGVGAILHDIYQGAESICELITNKFDTRFSQSGSYHRELLYSVTQPLLGVRPEILQAKTASALDEYLRFRHRFRKNYGFYLDWLQMKHLLNDAPPVIDAFAADIQQFIAFLRLMGDDRE